VTASYARPFIEMVCFALMLPLISQQYIGYFYDTTNTSKAQGLRGVILIRTSYATV
jgi:hypothetical protein